MKTGFAKSRLLAVVVVAMLALMFQSVPAADAQANCDSLVVDEAGVFGNRLSEVEREAQELESLGADVRVRAIETFGNAGNLDNYVAQVEDSCASWKAPDGNRKNNLIVVIVAIQDRSTSIFYGGQWTSALDDQHLRIQTDLMNPRFRDGDFAGGFIDGLVELQRVVDNHLHPQSQQPASGQVEVQPREPIDLSGLWRVLGWTVSLLFFGGLVVGAYLVLSRYFEEREKRREAQQKAKMAEQSVNQRIASWEDVKSRLRAKLDILKNRVAKEEYQPLEQKFKDAQFAYNSALVLYEDLDTTAGDPDTSGLTVSEYQAIERSYEKVQKELRTAHGLASDLLTEAASLQRLVSNAPGLLETAEASIKSAEEEIASVAREGFETLTASGQLESADEHLDEARKALSEKRFSELAEEVKKSQQLAISAQKSVQELPELKSKVQTLTSSTKERIEEVKNLILRGREIFEEISAKYAETSWQSVVGNGTEATKRVSWSLEAVEAATTHSDMQNQEWDEAQDALDDANSWLQEAESFMRSIISLKDNLEQAEEAAPKEIEAAKADIEACQDYILEHDPDIEESLEVELQGARQQLEEADMELARKKPDYLRVVRLARKANEKADDILEEARSQHELAERLRRKCDSRIREAKSSISKAEQFIEDHTSDVGRSAERDLENARKHLARARNLRENALNLEDTAKIAVLRDVYNRAEKADGFAEDAYDSSRRDFEEAEERRRTSRQSSIGYYDYGSSSGGGSSSWGSSLGGGGSSSWGGSIGGGGSTGW